MPTWTEISNPAVAVGGIPSSATVTALRDNPGAMAGAAAGAPVIFAGWHPVDKVSVGDSADGLIYSHAVDGTVAEIVTPDFEDGYEYRIVADALSHNSGSNRNLVLQLYRETDANYATLYTSTTAVSASSRCSLDVEILMPRISKRARFVHGLAFLSTTAEAVIATHSGSIDEKMLRAKLLFSVGNIDLGKVWMFRRREYATSP
jgi:hypothetical protein